MPSKKRMRRTRGGLPHPDVIPDERLERWVVSFLNTRRGRSHEECGLPERVFGFARLPYRGRHKTDVIGRLGAVLEEMQDQGTVVRYRTRTMTRIRLAGPEGHGPDQDVGKAPDGGVAVPRRVRRMIADRLFRLEREHAVRVLYACEWGSRAWGLASSDSDWDVRFIYVRSLEWYLSIETARRPDVIELPMEDGLDMSGWDARKALGLFAKSNPVLVEWLASPIVHRDHTGFADRLRELLPTYYLRRACRYHYLGMAKSNYRGHLRAGRVRRKKYLYVLRPLLALRRLELGGEHVPPTFPELLRAVPEGAARDAMAELLKRKTAGETLGEGPRIEVLNQFIERELERLDALSVSEEPLCADVQPLDEVFRHALRDAWDDES